MGEREEGEGERLVVRERGGGEERLVVRERGGGKREACGEGERRGEKRGLW